MGKTIDADRLIKDLKDWVFAIKSIRDDNKCFFTEENILELINRQPDIAKLECKHSWAYIGCDEYICSKCGERKFR